MGAECSCKITPSKGICTWLAMGFPGTTTLPDNKSRFLANFAKGSTYYSPLITLHSPLGRPPPQTTGRLMRSETGEFQASPAPALPCGSFESETGLFQTSRAPVLPGGSYESETGVIQARCQFLSNPCCFHLLNRFCVTRTQGCFRQVLLGSGRPEHQSSRTQAKIRGATMVASDSIT